MVGDAVFSRYQPTSNNFAEFIFSLVTQTHIELQQQTTGANELPPPKFFKACNLQYGTYNIPC